MDNANHIRHLKVVGKLAKAYDNATADATAQEALLAAFVDQYADGTPASLAAIRLMPTYTSSWSGAIGSGSTAIQTMAVNACKAYLTDPNFTGDLTTVPAGNSAAAVLTAWAADTVADSKTLTTKGSSGIVNFLDAVAGASQTWNTASDGSATYKDSVYCVATVV
ncbi:MAG TPA: hypothetical protein VGP72_10485 [Planctomycetota bacterium]|jgi:hypothetical protein